MEEDEENIDPENYYSSDPGIEVSEEVKAFLECTFRRCITKRKRLEISREYPKPKLEVMSVPKADKDIASILDKEFPAKETRSSLESKQQY